MELSNSINENGLLVPIMVRNRSDGGYEIITGHRRKRVCEVAGITKIKAIINNVDDDTATIIMVAVSFIVNIYYQAKRLFPIK